MGLIPGGETYELAPGTRGDAREHVHSGEINARHERNHRSPGAGTQLQSPDKEMDVVRKVPVPADVFRALLRCESNVNDVFIRRFRCTAEVTGPRPVAGPAPLKVYEKRPSTDP
ncbi:unnamed protein product [Ranitomeya imitator]|uniref:Uncharacterized protein n=1 Tax=Ranitomeya imitator TaxID=111125 RepID=A0ABN9LZQ9_9NEOB|nr:unnamed protein product [Ranitomeya imitator]